LPGNDILCVECDIRLLAHSLTVLLCLVNGGDEGEHVDTPRFKSISLSAVGSVHEVKSVSQTGLSHEVRYSAAALPTAPSSRPSSVRSNARVSPAISPSAVKSVSYIETPCDTPGQLQDESVDNKEHSASSASLKLSSETAEASGHSRRHSDTSRVSDSSRSPNLQESAMKTVATHEPTRSTANSQSVHHNRPIRTSRLAVCDFLSLLALLYGAGLV